MHNPKIILTLALALAALPACDDSAADTDAACPDGEGEIIAAEPMRLAGPVDGPPRVEVSFRKQGPSFAEYITTIGGYPARLWTFTKALMTCEGVLDPPLTCTLSWYQPDLADPDKFVIGWGCTMVGTEALRSCYHDLWQQNGSTPL